MKKEYLIYKLSEEMKEATRIDTELFSKFDVKRGLRNEDGTGVLVGLTRIGNVVGYERVPGGGLKPIPGKLFYRGYDVEDISHAIIKEKRFGFEEVAYLLLSGRLPDKEELLSFRELINDNMPLEQKTKMNIIELEGNNIMNILSRSVLEMYRFDANADDPIDSLEYHIKTRESGFEIKMLPTWRPDKAMAVEVPADFRSYVEKLAEVSGVTISNFDDMIAALRKRHDFFAEQGCRLSDHGIEEFYAEDYTDAEIKAIFNKVYGGTELTKEEILKFKSAMLVIFGEMDWEKGWTQQFHYGAIRNNNTKMFKLLGADTGFDSIGEFTTAKAMAKFLDRLNTNGKLTKTILYNLNPCANEVIATMLGNFQDGSIPGKIQFGSGWWFLDQKDGMEKQMNALSVLGLLSRFVGMLTDSRSFLSYPRHEYFRRTLCNLVGRDVENGEIPASEMERVNQMIEDISYNNAKNFFKF